MGIYYHLTKPSNRLWGQVSRHSIPRWKLTGDVNLKNRPSIPKPWCCHGNWRWCLEVGKVPTEEACPEITDSPQIVRSLIECPLEKKTWGILKRGSHFLQGSPSTRIPWWQAVVCDILDDEWCGALINLRRHCYIIHLYTWRSRGPEMGQ